MGRVLGLFAKWPWPGTVKTRIGAATSPEWAAGVARAFLGDLVRRLAGVGDRRVLAFAPRDAEVLFAEVAGPSFALAPQAEGDLGQRLSSFFNDQLAASAGSVVVLGTDSPTVPLAFIDEAFTALERADVVLGPATDGGYYLVGCSRRTPPIFEGVAWGGPTVLAETVARLVDPGWHLHLLPPWYDVDTLDDWRMLRGHVAALRRAGLDPGISATEALCRDSQP
jgi:rSAM/selenodomain-associated transferase 1